MGEERGKKRAREEEEHVAVDNVEKEKATDDAPAAASAPEQDDDDAPLLSNFKMSKAVCKGHECPYLDSISRQVTITYRTILLLTEFSQIISTFHMSPPFLCRHLLTLS